MDLHRSYVSGRLFEFASTVLEMKGRWRLLLYPLSRTLEVKRLVGGLKRTEMGMNMGR